MSATQPIVVDLYCRSATDGLEARTSLEQQATACRAYCEEHGLSVGQVHYEVGSGSTYRNRERLSLLRRRYRSGSIQGIVVTNLDRLSRSHSDLAILLGEMEAYGITLHCVNERIDDTPMGRFVRFILDFVTELEREKARDTLLTDPER
jgi:DNA invertase Pin-like site-specific DNA recombinase